MISAIGVLFILFMFSMFYLASRYEIKHDRGVRRLIRKKPFSHKKKSHVLWGKY